MISKEHHKHSKIARPDYGFFSRNEWALVGTTCSNIQKLSGAIIKALSPQFKFGYVDAEHSKDSTENTMQGSISKDAVVEYINKNNVQQFNFNAPLNQFNVRKLFSEVDAVFVNGNHFEAKAQVIVIDEIKKESLKKRIGQLTNVQLILLNDNADDVFDFVKAALPAWQQVPTYKINDTEKIIDFFKDKMSEAKPKLNGLVLAGGKSIRMGFDKSSIQWHGKEQIYYMAELLAQLCNDVFISCREGQTVKTDKKFTTIIDNFIGLGPYGAILSAFREQPDSAWMVVACDQPFLDIPTLKFLKENRNVSSIATTFQSPYDELPEPLVTIWEPRSYPVLLNFLAQGFSCPRKVLINNHNVTILTPADPAALKNVNTPADLKEVRQMISDKIVLPGAS